MPTAEEFCGGNVASAVSPQPMDAKTLHAADSPPVHAAVPSSAAGMLSKVLRKTSSALSWTSQGKGEEGAGKSSSNGWDVESITPAFTVNAEEAEEEGGESLPVEMQVADLSRMFRETMGKVEGILKEGCFFR